MRIGWISRRQCTLALVSLAWLSTFTFAEGKQASRTSRSTRSQVSIPQTKKVDFVSTVNGRRFELSIAYPLVPPPAEGYPVLYVLDGPWYFAGAADVVRAMAPGVVVVGIGYPEMGESYSDRSITNSRKGDEVWRNTTERLRDYDLTLPVSEATKAAQDQVRTWDRTRNTDYGHVDEFLKTIEVDVKPRVESLVPINSGNQAIFGHSHGGQAVLHALFVEPNSFRTFIIASPSIWWSNKAVLADEPRFAAEVEAGHASPRVAVTMGSEESTPGPIPEGWSVSLADWQGAYRDARMVENADELVKYLRQIKGRSEYQVAHYFLLDGEGHSEAAWTALVRGVRFAFPGSQL